MRERRGTSILILFGSIFNVQNNPKAQVKQAQAQTQPTQPVQAPAPMQPPVQPPTPAPPKPPVQPQVPLPTPPIAPVQQPLQQPPQPPIPPQQGIPNAYPPQRPPMGPPQMVPQPNIPPPMPYPTQQVPPGQIPAQAPHKQFRPQPDDPYLFPGRIPAYMQPSVPVTAAAPEIPLETEAVVEFKEEPTPMYGTGEVVEHDVLIEKIVEAPSMESSTIDLQSASVVEVEEERVIEFTEEVRYSVEEGNEPVVESNEKEGVWKPPDAED